MWQFDFLPADISFGSSNKLTFNEELMSSEIVVYTGTVVQYQQKNFDVPLTVFFRWSFIVMFYRFLSSRSVSDAWIQTFDLTFQQYMWAVPKEWLVFTQHFYSCVHILQNDFWILLLHLWTCIWVCWFLNSSCFWGYVVHSWYLINQ